MASKRQSFMISEVQDNSSGSDKFEHTRDYESVQSVESGFAQSEDDKYQVYFGAEELEGEYFGLDGRPLRAEDLDEQTEKNNLDQTKIKKNSDYQL